MKFLIDENLPSSIAEVFCKHGYSAEVVNQNPELRSQSDEVLFQYAKVNQLIVVTRDVKFLSRYDLVNDLISLVIVRCDYRMSTKSVCKELDKALDALKESDFHGVIIIEAGILRLRDFR